MKKTATLTLSFEDGSEKIIPLKNAIELGVGPSAKQSLEFRETNSGEWVMAFTRPLFDGKKIKSATFVKE